MQDCNFFNFVLGNQTQANSLSLFLENIPVRSSMVRRCLTTEGQAQNSFQSDQDRIKKKNHILFYCQVQIFINTIQSFTLDFLIAETEAIKIEIIINLNTFFPFNLCFFSLEYPLKFYNWNRTFLLLGKPPDSYFLRNK